MNLLFLFLSIFVSFVSPSSSNTEGNTSSNGTITNHHDDSNGVKKHKMGGNEDFIVGDTITP